MLVHVFIHSNVQLGNMFIFYYELDSGVHKTLLVLCIIDVWSF